MGHRDWTWSQLAIDRGQNGADTVRARWADAIVITSQNPTQQTRQGGCIARKAQHRIVRNNQKLLWLEVQEGDGTEFWNANKEWAR